MEEAANNPDQPAPAKRGEAAWKENLARIGERNAQVKKEGMRQREEYEREKADRRRERELRDRVELTERGKP